MPKSVVQKATDDFVLRMGHCTLNLMGMALENLRRYDVEHRNEEFNDLLWFLTEKSVMITNSKTKYLPFA